MKEMYSRYQVADINKLLLHSLVLSCLFVFGCRTSAPQGRTSAPQESKPMRPSAYVAPAPRSPYDYKGTVGDATVVTDKFVKATQVARLKVSVIPKSTEKDQSFKTDRFLCSKMVGVVSKNAFFEIVARDDLARVVMEGENSGIQDTGVVPSELAIVIESKIVNYLGGFTDFERKQKEAWANACLKKGWNEQYYKAMADLKAGAQKTVDDPEKAFGVEMFVKCTAYDVETKRLYVSDAQTVSKITETKGRIDAAIDKVAEDVAVAFAKKLSECVAPAMKTDSVIEETRGDGAVAKVNVEALQRNFRVGEEVKVYTHVPGKNKPKRIILASGRLLKIEDEESVWIKVEKENGYGKVHVGHCVDFTEVN